MACPFALKTWSSLELFQQPEPTVSFWGFFMAFCPSTWGAFSLFPSISTFLLWLAAGSSCHLCLGLLLCVISLAHTAKAGKKKKKKTVEKKQPFITRTSDSTGGKAQGHVFQPTHRVSWASCVQYREKEFPPITHTSQVNMEVCVCTSPICLLGHPCGLGRNGCRVSSVSPRLYDTKNIWN